MPRTARAVGGAAEGVAVRVVIAQIAPVVGDVPGNLRRMVAALERCVLEGGPPENGPTVLCFPELTVCGYPPRDLLDRSDLLDACDAAVAEFANATARAPGIVAVFGAPVRSGGLRNSAVVAYAGAVAAVRHKSLLPCYDVFDEPRWFVPEDDPRPVEVAGIRLGVIVCEDAWNEPGLIEDHHYRIDPVARMVGCDLVVNLSASPFHVGKAALRAELVARQARQAGAPFAYCNQVGANDELVFDGGSFVVDARGQVIAAAPAFEEAFVSVRSDAPAQGLAALGWGEQVHAALVIGIRAYAQRCGFRSALIGLSGGIDSAVVACLAVDALGAQNVRGVGMPGPYSSPGSLTDAEQLARTLGIRWDVLPIGAGLDAMTATLAPVFEGRAPDLAEENLQSRLRGTLLMALSNKFGDLLLTTGNKSEVAVGYCTLYGDMNGGLAPIADLYKTEVYALARWINREREVIPRPTLDKPPSAELRPGQTDQDSLPPYEVLDRILRLHVEESLGPEAIVARGEDPAVVREVVRLVRRAEFKRWQAAPGLRVSTRAFGTGRRHPLAMRDWTS